MECFKCFYEWQDSIDTFTGICPNCNANLVLSLKNEPQNIKPEYILQYIVQCFGYDVLQHKYVISGIISDVFSHDSSLKRLIQLSLMYKIPNTLKDIEQFANSSSAVESIINSFSNKASISIEESEKVVFYWQFAIDYKAPTLLDDLRFILKKTKEL